MTMTRQRADGKNSHLGVSGGVGVSVGAGTGIYAYVEVGGGKGENHLDAQSHGQTRLQAKHLAINSQRDTTLSGARAQTEAQYLQSDSVLHTPANWQSGSRIWIVDWFAPYGDSLKMKTLTRRYLLLPGKAG